MEALHICGERNMNRCGYRYMVFFFYASLLFVGGPNREQRPTKVCSSAEIDDKQPKKIDNLHGGMEGGNPQVLGCWFSLHSSYTTSSPKSCRDVIR